jgi:hypothetical protein
MMGAAVAHRARRKQHQRGPQSLAATVDDVLGNLPDQYDIGMETVTDDLIDRLHVAGYRFK